MQKEIFEKINSIEWTRGLKRELYLIYEPATWVYCQGFKELKVKPYVYSLLIAEKGMWTIYRPKRYFEATLKSLIRQLDEAPIQVRKNLQVLERLNRRVDGLSRKSLRRLETKKKKIDFLNEFEGLVTKYWLYYLYNAFLGYAIESFDKKTKLLKKILLLKDTPNYLKFEKLFGEFCGYIGLNRAMAPFYSFGDVRWFLKDNKKPNIERRKEWILVFREKQKTYITTEGVARVQRALEKKEQASAKAKMKEGLKGIVVYKGKAKGRAVVVTAPSQYKKIEKGMVLVTPMTRPDIVPYLKNVKAIVTDEGGLLCHAAITSRELKVPCIVGTKLATKVLKDGDIVEVDAGRGAVKVLRQ